ncbi:hypothetical protein DFP72DRAFT_1044125 [Ephemerocybe angulata]|uniref:Uncharacterized protein n=1 Tax=Ephemerocybe angulata TaxID=980116 RepID=A0A8H6MB33_9AGAR|nr:hypothetical protein DFP72DRAFT_1044125 [Tulosesus angulatus]
MYRALGMAWLPRLLPLGILFFLTLFTAFGVLRMRGILSRAGWSWLFLIEWVTTSIPHTDKNLVPSEVVVTDREEVIAVSRILRDDPSKGDMHDREALTIKRLCKACLDYDLWPLYILYAFSFSQMVMEAQNIPASLCSVFRQRLQRSISLYQEYGTLETNLLTVPSCVGTIITMYAIAVVSESVNDRAFVSMAEDVWRLPLLIALRCLPDNPNPWIFYGLATGLLIFPRYTPIQVGWCSRNAGGIASRTVNASLYNMFVQASGIISSNIYRKDDAPTCTHFLPSLFDLEEGRVLGEHEG